MLGYKLLFVSVYTLLLFVVCRIIDLLLIRSPYLCLLYRSYHYKGVAASTVSANDDETYSEVHQTPEAIAEVEEDDASSWLLQIVAEGEEAGAVDGAEWSELTRALTPYNIRTATVRGWHRSGWVVSHGTRWHSTVMRRKLTSRDAVQWLRSLYGQRIKRFHRLHRASTWLHNIQEQDRLRILLVTNDTEPPINYSLVSQHLKPSTESGIYTTSDPTEVKALLQRPIHTDLPVYIVATPHSTHAFPASGDGLLKKRVNALQRVSQDALILGLSVVNLLALMDVFIVRHSSSWLGHALSSCYSVCLHNTALLLAWFILDYLIPPNVRLLSLQLLESWAITDVGITLRSDIVSVCRNPALCIGAIVLLGLCYRKLARRCRDTEWPLDVYWLDYFFRPSGVEIATSADDEDLQLLIERLAVPHLWLRPMLSLDYVRNLPVWRYNGGLESESESSSEDETSYETVSGSGDSSDGETEVHSSGTACCQVETKLTSWKRLTWRRVVAKYKRITSGRITRKLCDGDLPWKPKGNDHHHTHHYHRRTESVATPMPQHQPPEGLHPCSSCTICLESYRYGCYLCALPCGHHYHQQCIMGWLTRDHHHCPICRWPSYKSKPAASPTSTQRLGRAVGD